MRIIPVMDVRQGAVVRAVGGDREDYQPLISDLCPTGEPLPMAFALREFFHFEEVYVADLAALGGAMPDLELFAGLVELGFMPWVDAGVHNAAGAVRLRSSGAATIVGTETLASIEDWEQIARLVPPTRLALSLDLHDGELLNRELGEKNPQRLVEKLFAAAEEVRSPGPARLIVLDLAHVGRCEGPGTEKLIERLAGRFPDCEVLAGGGIRGEHDIRRMESAGAAGVLVASALHDGTIQPRCHT